MRKKAHCIQPGRIGCHCNDELLSLRLVLTLQSLSAITYLCFSGIKSIWQSRPCLGQDFLIFVHHIALLLLLALHESDIRWIARGVQI